MFTAVSPVPGSVWHRAGPQHGCRFHEGDDQAWGPRPVLHSLPLYLPPVSPLLLEFMFPVAKPSTPWPQRSFPCRELVHTSPPHSHTLDGLFLVTRPLSDPSLLTSCYSRPSWATSSPHLCPRVHRQCPSWAALLSSPVSTRCLCKHSLLPLWLAKAPSCLFTARWHGYTEVNIRGTSQTKNSTLLPIPDHKSLTGTRRARKSTHGNVNAISSSSNPFWPVCPSPSAEACASPVSQ